MVKYSLDSVKEGMVLGRSVFDPGGRLVLAAGYRLNRPFIQRLADMGYTEVFIEEKGTEEAIPEDIINGELRRQTEGELAQMQQRALRTMDVRDESKEQIENIIRQKSGQFKSVVLTPALRKRISDIIDTLLGSPRSLLSLATMKNMSSYRYRHCLNTTVIALHLGMKFNYNREELEHLGLGVMLMDVGMIAIPKSITEREGPLTAQERAIVNEHPNYGLLLLQRNPSVSPVSMAVAFQHHERQDGTGYPRGMGGTNREPIKRPPTETRGQITRFADIAAVADAYDAMTSDRPYAAARTHDDAVRELLKAAGKQLNTRVVHELIRSIPIYPVGSQIVVRDSINRTHVGCRGVVAQIRHDNPLKPVLILTRNRRGDKLSPPHRLDLAVQHGMKIELVT